MRLRWTQCAALMANSVFSPSDTVLRCVTPSPKVRTSNRGKAMVAAFETGRQKTTGKPGTRTRRPRQVSAPSGAKSVHVVAFESAREAGLLEGDRTTHVSFRAPRALVDAAMKESGVTTPSELGILALAALAQPDPVAAFMRENRGRLGKDHKLEY